MPTYAYACTACDDRFEVHQAFSDDALTECPRCEGQVRKLFGSVGIVFKGSGFYRTDSRAGSSSDTTSSTSSTPSTSSSTPAASGSGSSGSGSSGSGSSGSSASTSAAKPAAAASS